MNFSKLLLLISLFGVQWSPKAQERQFKIHTVAFYNLENLFDVIDDPNKLDEYSPIMELKSGRDVVYAKKLHNMARVMSDIGFDTSKTSPSIIGICEVENRKVIQDLINDSLLINEAYGIAHKDSPDSRGIDVALLYKKAHFKPTQINAYKLKIFDDQTQKQVYTRDQLLVSGRLDNDPVHIIVNHWPSRRGGETRSKPKRIAAAKLNKRIIDSLQVINPYSKIIIMGDFNDNPNSYSIKSILKPEKESYKVKLKGLYNPYMNLYKKGVGTTAYRDNWSLFDQIMLSKPFLESEYNTYRFYKAGIYNKHYLIHKQGKYKGYPYRSWSNGGFSNGYSDHFPVYVQLIKEVEK
ncbi:endonuclease/exonuclease/phosphatase family protein [Cognatitamlana onchidii]|uniref:endonuclease/exonuclease/phosphatase family protein n=1 Tax=Cognatitamlana onchidii TaxID=2562860 RepID=UPI0010A6A032|nr:endonuclease/exonuclease/phosphatase family protein [Algibacter onchidii]